MPVLALSQSVSGSSPVGHERIVQSVSKKPASQMQAWMCWLSHAS